MTTAQTEREEIEICIGFYKELERQYEELNLDGKYLRTTAGVELFNTDGERLTPCIPYILEHLAKAEEVLARKRKSLD